MNVMMLSLMYPEDTKKQVARDVKDKLQNQINSYQRAFVEGIKANLLPDERLEDCEYSGASCPQIAI